MLARLKIIDKAKVAGVLRLPSDTFSGTSVTTDILFLQKRAEPLGLDFKKSNIAEIKAQLSGDDLNFVETYQKEFGKLDFYENALFTESNNKATIAASEYIITQGMGGRERIGYKGLDSLKNSEVLAQFYEKLGQNLTQLSQSARQTKDIENLADLQRLKMQFRNSQVGSIKYENGVLLRNEIEEKDGTKYLKENTIDIEEFALGERYTEYKNLKSAIEDKTATSAQKAG